MRHTFPFQNRRQPLVFFNRNRANQNRLSFLVQRPHFIGHSFPLSGFGLVNSVRIILANHRLIGRNLRHFQIINFVKFLGGSGRGSGHARKFFVEPKVILKSNRGQSARLLPHCHSFFRLHGLVQSLGPSASRHQASGKLIHDNNFAVLNHVVALALENGLSPQGLLQMMDVFDSFLGINIFQA